MVLPAMQLAAKVPDVYLQLWSASLVKGEVLWSRKMPYFYLLAWIFCLIILSKRAEIFFNYFT